MPVKWLHVCRNLASWFTTTKTRKVAMVAALIQISELTRQPCLTPTFGKCCDDAQDLGSLSEIFENRGKLLEFSARMLQNEQLMVGSIVRLAS